jgi:hypothetical protein
MVATVRSRCMRVLLSALVAAVAWSAGPAPVRYRNLDPKVAYAGSKSCAASGCHDRLSSDFRRTPMGDSMAPASRPEEFARVPQRVTIFNPDFDRYFEVYREGDDLYQSEYQKDPDGNVVFKTTHKLEYVTGGGMNGYTYLIRRGNHLFEAPLSYYSKAGKWDLSPGYVAADAGFGRPVLEGCLACHNGQPRAVPNREALYQEPAFRFGEMAISCEACHGPGELHNKQFRSGAKITVPDPTIVNPARLGPRLADDVCMNCHQGGHTRILQPGKGVMDFRPGIPLNQISAIFKLPLKKEQAEEANRAQVEPPVRGSVEMPSWWKNSSMEMSKCFQASGGKLRCVSCHSIHKPPTPATRAAFYREKCLTCHSTKRCALPVAERLKQSPDNDCAGCHMVKRPVGGIAHSSLTNHRIMRRPGQPLPDIAFEEEDPALPGIIYLNPPPGGASTLPALTRLGAYGEIMKKQPALSEQYLKVLDDLARNQPDDPIVLAALGRKAWYEKNYPQAVEYLSKAREKGSDATTTFLDLGNALAGMGRLEDAVTVFKEGIEVSPYAQVLQKSLALNYIGLKQYPKAYEVMKRYVELFPEDSFMRGLLQKVEAGRPSSGQ